MARVVPGGHCRERFAARHLRLAVPVAARGSCSRRRREWGVGPARRHGAIAAVSRVSVSLIVLVPIVLGLSPLTVSVVHAQDADATCAISYPLVARRLKGLFPGEEYFYYTNPSGSDVTFTTRMRTNRFFGPEHDVIESFVIPAHGFDRVVGPAGVGFWGVPTGSDRIVIEISANGTVVERCEHTMAVRDSVLSIPVRWCVVGEDTDGNGRFSPGERGVPAYTNPAGAGAADTDGVLLDRLSRLSAVWDAGGGSGPGIVFRSALPASAGSRFPVIPDTPDIVSGHSYGDVLSGGYGSELQRLLHTCQEKWTEVLGVGEYSLPGITALDVGKIDIGMGGPRAIAAGKRALLKPPGLDVCLAPDLLEEALSADSGGVQLGFVVASDNQAEPAEVIFDNSPPNRTLDEDPQDTVLAHEFGHVLHLEHGNGRDDDGDGLFDACDPGGEDPFAPPDNLMQQFGGPGDGRIYNFSGVITEEQKAVARAVAREYAGCLTTDPSDLYNWVACDSIPDAIGDERTDALGDVDDPGVDILSLSIVENKDAEITALSHEVGPIGTPSNSHYLVFADLDDNPSTGGAPASLGFATAFQGAELVTRVFVTDDAFGSQTTEHQAWRFDGGAFVDVTDDTLVSGITSAGFTTDEPVVSSASYVSIQMSNAVRGPREDRIRVQAIAQNLDPGGELDRLPDASPAGGVAMFMTFPEYPHCNVTPEAVAPGTQVTLEARGLTAYGLVEVSLGGEVMAEWQTNGAGEAAVTFIVPADAAAGERLVLARMVGTAIAANCTVEVFPRFVSIDIEPGSERNIVAVGSGAVIPVAFITADNFDAARVLPDTVTFEGASPVGESGDVEDVDGDGDLDLVLHFRAVETQLREKTTVACLSGRTPEGVPIQGCDAIRVVPAVGVTAKQLIVIDKLAKASRAKAVYVAKDPGVTKGAGLDPADIGVTFDVSYDGETGHFTIPAGVSNGTEGWVANKATVAKYVNKSAPGGSTAAKVAVIKPAKLLKLVAKERGDADKLDILAAGPPAGSVFTAYCVVNGGVTTCHCTAFSGCMHKSIAGGTGAKLVCKSPNAPDGACAALP